MARARGKREKRPRIKITAWGLRLGLGWMQRLIKYEIFSLLFTSTILHTTYCTLPYYLLLLLIVHA